MCNAYQINGLCTCLLSITTPRFTPEPLLRQRHDGNLVDHVVWQVLVSATHKALSTDYTWSRCVHLVKVCIPGKRVYTWSRCAYLVNVCIPGKRVYTWSRCVYLVNVCILGQPTCVYLRRVQTTTDLAGSLPCFNPCGAILSNTLWSAPTGTKILSDH